MKTILAAISALALSGCASIACPTQDSACLASLEARRQAMGMAFFQSMQNKQPVYFTPAPTPTYVPTPSGYRPGSGSEVCNAQGVCGWQR